MSEERLLRTLKKDLVINVKDASKILGGRSQVYYLEKTDKISKVEPSGLGFFSMPDKDQDSLHYAILSKYYSKCVVSGKTALLLHGLGEDYIEKIDVDIPNTTNLVNPLFSVHRVTPKMIKNTQRKKFEDQGVPKPITIYTPERTLFEAYKYYGQGTDAFIRALKRYRTKYLDQKSPGKQYDIILKIDKKIGSIIIGFLRLEDVDE